MVPDTRLNHRGTETTAGARPRHIPRVAECTDIPAALRTPGAHHPPAAAPTHQETPQEIRMLRVITLRPLAIPDELRLRPCPELGIDERRDPDRNPFGLRASHTALAIARVAIFQPAQPIGPPDVSRLRAIIVSFSFVEGVAEDLHHTSLCPLAPFGLPWGNAVGGETLMNGIGTQLLLDTPTIDLPDNFRFGLIDHEVLRRSCRLMDIGIPIGRISPVDPPLAGGKELPPTRASVDQSALR